MPSSGVWPSEIGESWFAELVTDSRPLSSTSHAQPEPNRLTPASTICCLNASNEPKALSIAAARSPLGVPPPFGPRIVQNSEWLAWPPALLRTGPCLSDGRLLRLASTSSTGLSPHSLPPTRGLPFPPTPGD